MSNVVQNFLLRQLCMFLQLLNSVLHLLLKYVSKAQTMFKLPKNETKSTLEFKLIIFWTEFRSCKNMHSWHRRKFWTTLLNIWNLKIPYWLRNIWMVPKAEISTSQYSLFVLRLILILYSNNFILYFKLFGSIIKMCISSSANIPLLLELSLLWKMNDEAWSSLKREK